MRNLQPGVQLAGSDRQIFGIMSVNVVEWVS